jgi:hypothetical protein
MKGVFAATLPIVGVREASSNNDRLILIRPQKHGATFSIASRVAPVQKRLFLHDKMSPGIGLLDLIIGDLPLELFESAGSASVATPNCTPLAGCNNGWYRAVWLHRIKNTTKPYLVMV